MEHHGSSVDRESHRNWWWLGPTLLAGGFYFWMFGGLMPLAEFRDWILFPVRDVSDLVGAMLLRDEAYTRPLALWAASFLGDASGRSTSIDNAALLGLSFAVGLLLFRLGRQVGMSRVAAGSALIVWYASTPVLDCLVWQATLLSRLALLFSLLAMSVAIRACQQPLTKRRIITANAVLLSLTVLAYNSKESAWLLAPGLVAICLVVPAGTLRERTSFLGLLVLPAVFMLNYYCQYLAMSCDPSWVKHSTSGSMAANLSAHIESLTSLPPEAGGGLLAVVVALALGPARRIYRGTAALSEKGRFLLVVFAGAAFGIHLRGSFAPAYYMYAPGAFLSLLFAFELQHYVFRFVEGWLKPAFTAFAFAVLMGAIGVRTLTARLPHYLSIRDHSYALQASLPLIRQHVSASQPRSVRFLVSPITLRILHGTAPGTAYHLFGQEDLSVWKSAAVEFETLAAENSVPQTGWITIRFDAHGALSQLWDGSDLVYGAL